MKAILSFALILSSILVYSQKVTMQGASRSSGINAMCFDGDNNRYIYGYYKGKAYFNTNLAEATKSQYYLSCMAPDNSTKWTLPLNDKKRRWQMHVNGSTLQALAWERQDNVRSITLEKYDLNGKKLSEKVLVKTENKDAAMRSFMNENGILVRATFKDDESNTVKYNGKTYTKKKYSIVVLFMFDLEGNLKWEYQMEGGYNGFTDLRVGDITLDKNGNAYVVSYFSESAELGIASLTTEIEQKGPIDLYDNGAFLLKIDNTGKGVKAMSIADYQIDFEKILVDDDQNIYLSAYYKGSDAYEKANPTEGVYKVAHLMGSPLPDTDGPGSDLNPGSEDNVIAKLDKDFNLVWKQYAQSKGYARASSMVLVGNDLHVCGTSGYKTTIGDKVLNLTEEGYSDMFYAHLDASTGSVKSAKGFVAQHSNLGNVYADGDGNVVVTGSFRNPLTIDGKTYQTVGSTTSHFIYDFNGNLSGGSSSSSITTTTTTTTNSSSSPSSSSSYKVGDRVMANWLYKGKYWPGKITRVSGGKYYVEYDDSGVEWCKTDQLIRESDYKPGMKPGSSTTSSSGTYKVGDRVEGNWKAGGRWYPGKIGKISGGRYFIQYDDGDTEWTTDQYIRRGK